MSFLKMGNYDLRQQGWWRIDDKTSPSVRRQHVAYCRKTSTWDEFMARKTYRIELKVDFNDDTRHRHMIEVAKEKARELLASSMLLQDGRAPQIALVTDDNFYGHDDIDVVEAE